MSKCGGVGLMSRGVRKAVFPVGGLVASNKTEEIEKLAATMPEPGRVAYTRQQEPLDLGHAVWCARNLVGDEPFAVLLADDLVLSEKPCLGQLVDVFDETGGNVVAVMEVPADQTDRYGVIAAGDDNGHIVETIGLVEKPDPKDAPSTLAVIGRYILSPDVFAHLGRQQAGVGGKIQLIHALAAMIGAMPFHSRYQRNLQR